MADYNPNSIWTGKKKENGSSPEPKAAYGASLKISGGSEKENIKTHSRGNGDGRGLLWFFVACAAFVAGAVFYFFLLKPTPSPSVSISFVKPNQVFVGDQFVFSVSLTNNSDIALKNAALEIILPDNFSFAGQPLDQRAVQQAMGDLGSGTVMKQDFNLIATGGPNSVGHITAKLTYGTDASLEAQFESDGAADVITGGPAVGLNFTVPQNVFAGQSFTIAANYNNNTPHAIQNVVFRMQYPPTFVFGTSNVAPASAGGAVWNIGTVAANASGSIAITGTVAGSANAVYPFTGTLASSISGIAYSLDTETANAAVAVPPLSISIAFQNASTSVVKAGDQLNYILSYANNSGMAFQNIVIQAALAGDMYDFSSFRSDGAFNSALDTVTWSPATNQELASLAPGQSGSVRMAVNVKKSFPIKSASDKNYVLKVRAQIQSPTIPPNTSASSTVGTADMESKIRGEIAVAATAYRDDPSSGIANSGPYPPSVNQSSQYTVHWDVVNYSTDAENVVVSAYLQSGSVFTGHVKSNTNSQPVYDAATGLVSWSIPSLPAGTGILGAPADAVFQLANTPAVNQAGLVVTVLTQTNLSADDIFTDSMLQASADPITTYLPKDPTVAGKDGRVVQ